MIRDISVFLTGKNDEETMKLVSCFRSEGVKISVFNKNGAELLKRMKEAQPDVVIMDDFMEHVDALGVLSRLEDLNPTKRPVTIVMLSVDNKNIQKSFWSAGVDYCFLKPVDAQLLAERVVQILSWKDLNTFENFQGPQALEIAVTEILHKVGIPARHKGFHYLRDAILLVIEHPEVINKVTAVLYPTVAKKYNSAPLAVERAMRYAIGKAWEKENMVLFRTYFGYTVSNPEKPSNSEFIARVSDDLRFKNRMHMKLDGPFVYAEKF